MSVFCNRFAGAAGVGLALAVTAACGSSDLLVGDDSRVGPAGPGANTDPPPDASPSGADATKDADRDVVSDSRPDAACPELPQPPPGFCDGGPVAPTYDSAGCISGFACTPILCAAAGGACVALVPGACATNHVGDASKYSCGAGIGVQCCLP